jgi:hypothetical protein
VAVRFVNMSMLEMDTRYSFVNNIWGNHVLVNEVDFTRCDERPTTHASLSRIYALFVWFEKDWEKKFQRRLCGERYMYEPE